MKRIKLLLFLLISTLTISEDFYKPKSKDEEAYLEEIQKKKLTLLLESSEAVNEKIDGESINSIIEDLFKNYLNMNIVVIDKKGEGEPDIIGVVKKNPKINGDLVFSKKLFSENLYIASKKINIERYGNIDGKIIYTRKGHHSVGVLNDFLEREGLNAKVKFVESTRGYENELTLLSGLCANGFSQKVSIGSIPDSAIGLSKEYGELIPILNSAILEKYDKKIDSHLKKQKRTIQKESFYRMLTEKEKRFLQKTRAVRVGYEINSKVSKMRNEKIKGIIPDVMSEVSQITGIKFILDSNGIGNWEKVSNNFKNKKINILAISNFNKKFKDYLFSKNIYNVDVYLVEKKFGNDSSVGVVRDTVYSVVADEYFFKKNIKEYSTSREQIADFKAGKIGSIITANIDIFNNYDYKIDEIKIIPLNLAFQKNEVLLRNIVNKAIDVIGKTEIDRIVKQNRLEENIKSFVATRNSTNLFKISVIIIGIGVIVILFLIYKFLSEKRISQTLRNDFLTNIPNRVVFNEFCQMNNKEVGIAALLDLNNFKQVNDKFNHKVGDKILVEIARILKSVFKNDKIFRISGDEFYCFFSEKGYEDKLELLKNSVKNSKMLKKYDVSFSLGYFKKTSNITLDEAFKYAGMAMRGAKENKKDLMMIEASENLIMIKGRELKLKEILKDSIKNEFYPVFQPKISMKNRDEILGAEALCRWKNKEFGNISPLEFIALGEDLKIIYLIDYKIAEEAIKSLKEWLDLGKVKNNFRISFNISMQTFDRDDMIEKIESLLTKYGVKGENIEIEITESALSNNISKAIEKLEKLKEKGIKIALDDFTAGHSTAAILPILPLDIVKFDKSLLDLYNKDRKKGPIIYKTLIKMIKDLKIETVAEGIENEEEYRFLKEEGIDIGQGYFLGKPVSKDRF